MSGKAANRKYNDLEILWAIRDIPKTILNYQRKGILSMFLACIGNNEACRYSMLQLENKLGGTERSLRQHFHALEDLDFLIIDRPPSYVKGANNEYRLNYDQIIKIANQYRRNQCDKI